MKKTKLKKCKVCKKGFQPRNSFHITCDYPAKCALEWARMKREKKEKKNLTHRKEKLKTASEWTREAQSAVNRYVRARDYGSDCICCGRKLDWNSSNKIDSGHWRSRASASHLRFNVLNIHAQSKKCNTYGFNIYEYEKRLVKKIGQELVDRIKYDNNQRRFTIEYLKRIKKIFNKRARWYEKRIDNRKSQGYYELTP